MSKCVSKRNAPCLCCWLIDHLSTPTPTPTQRMLLGIHVCKLCMHIQLAVNAVFRFIAASFLLPTP